MRTTRRSRTSRRNDATPLALAVREILNARAAVSTPGADEMRDRLVANERLRIASDFALLRVEALERRSRLMSAVGELMEVSPDALAAGASELLSRLACVLVPALADFVRVDLLREDGTLEGGAMVHTGPARCDGWMPDGAPVL